MAPPPTQISARAFIAAAHLLDDYFLPMAERVYGDAAAARARSQCRDAGPLDRRRDKASGRSLCPASSARWSACPA